MSTEMEKKGDAPQFQQSMEMEKQGDAPQFKIPVDSEHKATEFRVWSFVRPHMLSFHLSWFSFFTSFVSTFAPAAMIPVIRDAVNLQKADLGNAGIAAVTGTVLARVAMGSVCDTFGPRYGHAVLNMGVAPAVVGMALVTDNVGFLLCRLVIGFGLATFVANQFWSSVLFNVKIVGLVNATGGGWGNLGGGVTQLLMPLVYSAIKTGVEPFIAWRVAFFVPYLMHLTVGILVLTMGQDLPDGNYRDLKKKGTMEQDDGKIIFYKAITNYRTWCLVATYGFCFGVELTMNNIIVQYFFDQFDLSLNVAGVLGACFGLMNIFARSLGGFASDFMGNRFGMRGRLWSLWILQTVEGLLCILMGFLQNTLAGTMVAMITFSLFVQASEGASYGIVPFVSKRSLGVVSGLVGAGGNSGSAILQAAFFRDSPLETYEGIRYMGITIIGVTLLVIPIYFPMWGGMFCAPKKGATELDYYLADYTQEEKEAGLADRTIKFALESKSQRGMKASGL
eukprot:TRINITY_DN314_c0_g3_i1.p1 TRINITY_DN314_c0_g3~~TRINITY_DN314_c0_g3_i1.p1  ORF type:complete len:507 (-),score=48.08 TRINITY_DN314_c0_g3_i1:209-1729(-)